MLFGVGVVVEPGAVDKMGVRHPQLLRPLIHLLHKRCLRAADGLGQRRSAVVGRRDCDALDHVAHTHLLALFQIDLAAALGRRSGGGRDGVVPAQNAAVDGLHHQ